MTRTLAIIGITCFARILSAQDAGIKTAHTLSLKSRYIQIKDEFNYGLVNRGLHLAGEYTLISYMDKNIFSYQAALGFGVNYNQGVGIMGSLKPFDFFYGFRLNNNPEMPLTLGPYLSGYYKWFLYPELQSGHMFWISSYEVGPRFQMSLPVKSRVLNISLSSSLASLNSRPEAQTEQYYYSLTLSDFVSNPHSNMSFGSVNVYNHTDLRIELVHPPEKGFSIAYEIEFMGTFQTPAFRYMAHSVNLNWILGYKKSI